MALIDSLVSYWKFDDGSGNASDSTANVKTLTNNGTTTYSAGKLNSAADFGAANAAKSFSRAGYVVADGISSMSFWVKQQTEIASGTQTFVTLVSESTAFTISYEYNTGSRRLTLLRERNNLASASTSYTVTLGTANYYHIVMVYDLSSIILYVNGTNVSSTSTSLNGTTNWSPGGGYFSVGAKRDANDGTVSQHASCFVDELAIWNKVLSPTEVTNLYNTGNVNPYPFNLTYSLTCSAGSFLLTSRDVRFYKGDLMNVSKPTTTIVNTVKP
jgi:hypothetical protein